MFRLTIKELAARKLRLFSTALAVFLGVAFLAGTLMLTDTVTKAFDGVLSDAHEGTDAYVRGASPLDLSIADQRFDPGLGFGDILVLPVHRDLRRQVMLKLGDQRIRFHLQRG